MKKFYCHNNKMVTERQSPIDRNVFITLETLFLAILAMIVLFCLFYREIDQIILIR